ncbi:MAG: class I SAM-dependent methyltransferase [Bacteroidetes bacterium]|nr:class I SAM-dependent methyltransferase [Bacteroidota bacterium]
MNNKDLLTPVIDRSLNYGRHIVRRFLSEALCTTNGNVVLDIGAGWGIDLIRAREYNTSCELHAIEIEPEYIKELQANGIIVHTLNIEREKIPLSTESVDVIIANQIFEHIKEIFWVFHEATRVLRVGGFIIIGVPNLASFHNRVLLAFGKQPTCIQNYSAHLRGYTKSDLMKFLSACFPQGYILHKFAGSNFYPLPPVLAKPLSTLLPTMAWGIFFLFQKVRSYKSEFLVYPCTHKLETLFFLGNEHTI